MLVLQRANDGALERSPYSIASIRATACPHNTTRTQIRIFLELLPLFLLYDRMQIQPIGRHLVHGNGAFLQVMHQLQASLALLLVPFLVMPDAPEGLWTLVVEPDGNGLGAAERQDQNQVFERIEGSKFGL